MTAAGRIVRRVVRFVGHAPHERPAAHDERAAAADLGYSPTTPRDCQAVPSGRHPGPDTNFLRAYLAGVYDPLADNDETKEPE
jgi:hypothetical protein